MTKQSISPNLNSMSLMIGRRFQRALFAIASTLPSICLASGGLAGLAAFGMLVESVLMFSFLTLLGSMLLYLNSNKKWWVALFTAIGAGHIAYKAANIYNASMYNLATPLLIAIVLSVTYLLVLNLITKISKKRNEKLPRTIFILSGVFSLLLFSFMIRKGFPLTTPEALSIFFE